MTVTRVPASNPEPEFEPEGRAITDPTYLASLQPDDDGGLDGNGTWSAADLPASAWQATSAPLENGSPDLGLPTPVGRTLCLKLSDDRVMPLQCRFRAGHADECDWDREPTVLTETRTKVLLEEQDADVDEVTPEEFAEAMGLERVEVSTPSGRLPRIARWIA